MLSDRFIRVFYKTTTCPSWPLLSGLKSGNLIQFWLYHYSKWHGKIFTFIFTFEYKISTSVFLFKFLLFKVLLLTHLVCYQTFQHLVFLKYWGQLQESCFFVLSEPESRIEKSCFCPRCSLKIVHRFSIFAQRSWHH